MVLFRWPLFSWCLFYDPFSWFFFDGPYFYNPFSTTLFRGSFTMAPTFVTLFSRPFFIVLFHGPFFMAKSLFNDFFCFTTLNLFQSKIRIRPLKPRQCYHLPVDRIFTNNRFLGLLWLKQYQGHGSIHVWHFWLLRVKFNGTYAEFWNDFIWQKKLNPKICLMLAPHV